MTLEQTANRIVNFIIQDLQNRKGLGDEFNNINKEIRWEIVNKWRDIATEELKKYEK